MALVIKRAWGVLRHYSATSKPIASARTLATKLLMLTFSPRFCCSAPAATTRAACNAGGTRKKTVFVEAMSVPIFSGGFFERIERVIFCRNSSMLTTAVNASSACSASLFVHALPHPIRKLHQHNKSQRSGLLVTVIENARSRVTVANATGYSDSVEIAGGTTIPPTFADPSGKFQASGSSTMNAGSN